MRVSACVLACHRVLGTSDVGALETQKLLQQKESPWIPEETGILLNPVGTWGKGGALLLQEVLLNQEHGLRHPSVHLFFWI